MLGSLATMPLSSQLEPYEVSLTNFALQESNEPVMGLVMSPSVLMDRIFLYTDFLPTLNQAGQIMVWSDSASNADWRRLWNQVGVNAAAFPEIAPLKGFPHSFLRRVNDYAWDLRTPSASKDSMVRLMGRGQVNWLVRLASQCAKVAHWLRLPPLTETVLESMVKGQIRSIDGMRWLMEHRPKFVLTTGPFQFNEPAIIAQARSLGIPIMALIPSWDNLSTKNRLIFDYDGYLVWSEAAKQELHRFYPKSRERPVHVIGVPQFDVFHQSRFQQTREEFAESQGLDPNRPILVYAIGSPNFLKGEPEGALQFAKRVAAGDLGNAQLIVRPHPLHDSGQMERLFQGFEGQVLVQRPVASDHNGRRGLDERQIRQWVNSIRHADVLINLSSTVTIEAALCDRPIVNLDYDPAPNAPQQQLIHEINHRWNHFQPIAESGGLWLVRNLGEAVMAVQTYLKQPQLHRDQRRWIAEHVCGLSDGRAGKRMAEAVLSIAAQASANK